MSGIPAGAGALLGKRLGKYEILALLALGGTAEIYLARIAGASGFEKYVVVKCLHDHLADDVEFVKMFLDEARLAAHLDHSNIVQTMELGEHQTRYYMVMEFLGGLSLAMVIRRAPERLAGGKLPVHLSLNIMAQAAAGLHYAHERTINGKVLNIVHRDISPQNLVVSFEGVVKVVDFGIAKAEMRETSTRSGTIKGKFAYMSPEQCVANNVDRRTDVFALGVITHELLTGTRLFKRNSPYETYQAVIDCNVPLPSKINHELDPGLDAIVMKALAKEKEKRYPTAEAFGDALLGYLHHRGKPSGPSEVGRFFDTSFQQEIEEHGARMRELIEGRKEALDMGWGVEEDQRPETVDLGGRGSVAQLGTQDIDVIAANRGSLSAMSNLLDDLGSASGDEDMPVERTRIEANPLEIIEEHQQKLAAAAQTLKPVRQILPPSGATPLPPPPSGKFPDSANMRTQIAQELHPAKAHAHEQNTRIAPLPMGPSDHSTAIESQAYQPPQPPPAFTSASTERTHQAPAYRATARPFAAPAPEPAQPPRATPARGMPMRSGSISQVMDVPEIPQRATQPTQPPPMARQTPQAQVAQRQTAPSPVVSNVRQTAPSPSIEVRPSLMQPAIAKSQPHQMPQQAQMPASYPVLNAALAAEVPERLQQRPQVQAAMQRHDDRASLPNLAPPQPPMQMPSLFNGMNGESGLLVQPPRPGDAAAMVSPVGPGYPQRDWETAAAKPAKAVPKWMFGLLFVVGFGLALLLTIVIARAAR